MIYTNNYEKNEKYDSCYLHVSIGCEVAAYFNDWERGKNNVLQ
jgi:hypothetical protein